MPEPIQLSLLSTEVPGKRGGRKSPFRASCRHCGHRFELSRALRGHEVHCPMCEGIQVISPPRARES